MERPSVDTQDKLGILADDSRYDLACACGGKGVEDHRTRGADGLWLYPTSVPRGGKSVLLKTLMSNACAGDCLYCPLRSDEDRPRCSLSPEEVARVFMDYFRRDVVFGLFLSSGVIRSPDHTMDRLVAVGRILRRKYAFRGYLHLKIIPGCSDAAIEAALSVASTVSVNVEAPTGATFAALSRRKDYMSDIVRPIKLISKLTGRGMPYSRINQSTQFVVGASTETDDEIIQATSGLYDRQNLSRVYYSAYQRGLGDPALPGERNVDVPAQDLLTREHRLYQVDFLMRKYGYEADEIPLESSGNLSLTTDPKQHWADLHPERFPIDVNVAPKKELLRVPGLGPVTVGRIMKVRKDGSRLRTLGDVGRVGKLLTKAGTYVHFGDRRRA
jgi:predicted DNA-binding helix-hairpin-helix protein